jgi:hypothetical protein
LCPGLAKPDNDPAQLVSKDILMKELDDMMSQFEQAVHKSKSRPRMTDDPRDEDDQNVGAFVKLEGIAGRIEGKSNPSFPEIT